MKIKCDFCKTEYAMEKNPNAPVKCAVCGNVWRVAEPQKKNSWLLFFAALCALLSAIVFTVVAITHHQIKTANRGPLVATVTSVDTATDDNGVQHLVVSGTVENISSEIYGVPELIIVSTDDKGKILAQQKFMPSATLLDAGTSVNFIHTLAQQPFGVKKISAHLAEIQVPQENNK
jgi:hypothetical protein